MMDLRFTPSWQGCCDCVGFEAGGVAEADGSGLAVRAETEAQRSAVSGESVDVREVALMTAHASLPQRAGQESSAGSGLANQGSVPRPSRPMALQPPPASSAPPSVQAPTLRAPTAPPSPRGMVSQGRNLSSAMSQPAPSRPFTPPPPPPSVGRSFPPPPPSTRALPPPPPSARLGLPPPSSRPQPAPISHPSTMPPASSVRRAPPPPPRRTMSEMPAVTASSAPPAAPPAPASQAPFALFAPAQQTGHLPPVAAPHPLAATSLGSHDSAAPAGLSGTVAPVRETLRIPSPPPVPTTTAIPAAPIAPTPRQRSSTSPGMGRPLPASASSSPRVDPPSLQSTCVGLGVVRLDATGKPIAPLSPERRFIVRAGERKGELILTVLPEGVTPPSTVLSVRLNMDGEPEARALGLILD